MLSFRSTRSVLQQLAEALKCKICNNVSNNPHTVGGCGHFFCYDCLILLSISQCPECKQQFYPSDLVPDGIAKPVLNEWKVLCSLVGLETSMKIRETCHEENEKGLENKSNRKSLTDETTEFLSVCKLDTGPFMEKGNAERNNECENDKISGINGKVASIKDESDNSCSIITSSERNAKRIIKQPINKFDKENFVMFGLGNKRKIKINYEKKDTVKFLDNSNSVSIIKTNKNVEKRNNFENKLNDNKSKDANKNISDLTSLHENSPRQVDLETENPNNRESSLIPGNGKDVLEYNIVTPVTKIKAFKVLSVGRLNEEFSSPFRSSDDENFLGFESLKNNNLSLKMDENLMECKSSSNKNDKEENKSLEKGIANVTIKINKNPVKKRKQFQSDDYNRSVLIKAPFESKTKDTDDETVSSSCDILSATPQQIYEGHTIKKRKIDFVTKKSHLYHVKKDDLNTAVNDGKKSSSVDDKDVLYHNKKSKSHSHGNKEKRRDSIEVDKKYKDTAGKQKRKTNLNDEKKGKRREESVSSNDKEDKCCSEIRKKDKPKEELVSSSIKNDKSNGEIRKKCGSNSHGENKEIIVHSHNISSLNFTDNNCSDIISISSSSDVTIEDTPLKNSSNKPKTTTRRNNKGETPLHVACRRGQLDFVKELLAEGADPNTKDNAGWTPLHEAVEIGNATLVEILLDAGVNINVPGPYNSTPLLEAVLSDKIVIVRLLLQRGADINLRSSFNYMPLNCAKSDDMKKLLSSYKTTHALTKRKDPPVIPMGEPKILFCLFLDNTQINCLTKFCAAFRLKYVFSLSDAVTHVIVNDNGSLVCPPDVSILHAIVKGLPIVSYTWVECCLKEEKLLKADEYEIKGTDEYPESNAPFKSRQNTAKLFPRLFNGLHVSLPSHWPKKVAFTKEIATAILRDAGAKILAREPKPEAIPPEEAKVMFHADIEGPMSVCSHVILYVSGHNVPLLQYNMRHIRTLPTDWVLRCIQTFSILDPTIINLS